MDNAIQPPEGLSATSPQLPANPTDEVDWTGKVLGEFRLLHRLGRGGMGQVYLAEQTSLKRKVALKLLHPDLACNERSLQRFKAEAENVAKATHANIVQIYTIGQTNGVNYIALEYVEGRNLREFIEKKGTPELPLGLHIMMQVAAALQRAAELNIIHRDIKPENILLTRKGEVKVADFGLSRLTEGGQQTSLTQSQVTMGTPLYMSPEQVERSKSVDTRTDIYSFGVTSYHMFAGNPPFRGTSPIDVAYQHVHKEPQPLGEIRPDLPADLCAIIHKMMAKKPEDRYQTAGEIVRDINRLREALNLGAVVAVSISSSFIGIGADGARGTATQTWPGSGQRHPWVLRIVMIATVILALAGGLALGWNQHRQNAAKIGPGPGNPPPVDPGQARPAFSFEERERMLKLLVQDRNPEGQLDANAALKARVDLGLLYLHHKRIKEAEEFFKEIGAVEPKVPAYQFLARLGHAIVLAFKDEPAASNKEFLAITADIEKIESRIGAKGAKKGAALFKEELEAYRNLWKDKASVRELVAKALNHNYANDSKKFPPELNAYRFPPRPTLKAAP